MRGGFRFVTGAIGKKFRKNYRLTSAIATIGIRGSSGGTFVGADSQSVRFFYDPADPGDLGGYLG